MKLLQMQMYAVSIHFFLHTTLMFFNFYFITFIYTFCITKYIPFLSSLPYSQALNFVSFFILHLPQSKLSVSVSLSTRQLFLSVDRPLEDEFNVALFPSQPRSTERTSSVEGMRSVWQWDLTPTLHRLFRAHVTAGAERMCGGPRVQVQAPFAPKPEGHVGTHPSAHGTLSVSCGSRSCASAPN